MNVRQRSIKVGRTETDEMDLIYEVREEKWRKNVLIMTFSLWNARASERKKREKKKRE